MNNRELKFRAWDNLKKEWLKRKVYHFNPHFNEEGIGEFRLSQHPEGFTIQQYTGLKDRNGNDIYEGDILKYGDLYYEVMWADYQWIATCPYYNHYHWPKFESFGREARSSIVSGNIFENPELIKNDDE